MNLAETRIGLLAPITWAIPPEGYGPWERVVANLCKGLVAAGCRNVTLFATRQADLPGVRTVASLDRPLGEPGPENADKLVEEHIRHAFGHAQGHLDLVHNHLNWRPLPLFSKLPIPTVTTLHGSAIEPASAAEYRRHRELPYVSISNAERNFLPELNYLATVYNGIDFREVPFVPEGGGYLAFAGRIHPQKGPHHAIELAEHAGLPLRLAGPVTPDQEDYFEAEIRPRIRPGAVEYLGSLSGPDTLRLMGGAAATVGLIEWDEPFGLSMAESMACGTPVIATPRGAHREIVREGVSGVLVRDVDEAYCRLEEALRLDRRACRQAAEETFSLEAMARGYLAAYGLALAGANQAVPPSV
jgi:glycosyltransferase involved in cell wall biosynthesis